MAKRAQPRRGSPTEITAALIDEVGERLAANKRVRRTLPDGGRLHVDRQLPFLCVYRRPDGVDDLGTDQFVKGEAAHLIAPGAERHRTSVAQLVERVAGIMVAEFGAVLILELWAGSDEGKANDAAVPSVPPRFEVLAPHSAALAKTVDVLLRRLTRVKVIKQHVEAELADAMPCAPPGMRPLLTAARAKELGVWLIGVSVPPVYRDAKLSVDFPMLSTQLRHQLSRVFKQTFFHFTGAQTTHRPPHFSQLGRRAVVKAVWQIDRQLLEISTGFNFLRHVTPVNSNDAWREFKAANCERPPEFHYRPAPFDPPLLKRRLYHIPIERVEDPALQRIFVEKQAELDRKITMLGDRDTPKFLYGSLQLYGVVAPSLLTLAHRILELVPPPKPGGPRAAPVPADELAELARQEIAYYRARYPEFTAGVRVTRKAAGVLVSGGNVLINTETQVTRARVEPLLHHEVGTHLLTYFNGRAQPFRLLFSGLAGYDEQQEGLAVLAEYLVGGLEASRLRQLAARVVAVDGVVRGASFLDTFRVLRGEFGFGARNAFTISMRVHRGGGLTKDAAYLEGLRGILKYVATGGSLETLLVGKFAADHIPIIEELLLRGVLREPALRPRYLTDPAAVARLEALRGTSGSVLELLPPGPAPTPARPETAC